MLAWIVRDSGLGQEVFSSKAMRERLSVKMELGGVIAVELSRCCLLVELCTESGHLTPLTSRFGRASQDLRCASESKATDLEKARELIPRKQPKDKDRASP